MNELVATGVAMQMIFSDLPEILGMSDRILVMHASVAVCLAHFLRNMYFLEYVFTEVECS